MKKQGNKGILYRVCASVLSLTLAFSVPVGTFGTNTAKAASTSYNYELRDNAQNGAILQAWNWSYKTIEDNMELIAQSGYTSVQTSPCTQPKDYCYEGVVHTEVGTPGQPSTGNWWKLYQPVTESVCDNGMSWLGTKAELQHMCAVAEQYGVKVLVDVVANHMGNITGWQNSMSDISLQVGQYWSEDMMTDTSYWHINDYQTWMSDSRLHFTQGTVGMPDLNTADKKVQAMIANYLNELIDCGVDGFRFDCAKHIETPQDDSAFASDFWPTVLGEAKSHYTSVTGGTLYCYGEILNTVGLDFDINNYTQYMSVTDNSAGSHLLDAFRNNNTNTLNLNYAANKTVVYVESHDTYMSEASRFASDRSIARAYAICANKNETASVFFARPYYSSQTLVNDQDNQFRGDLSTTLEQATMGNCETYSWASKQVAAINHFKNRMQGVADTMGVENNVVYSFRGNGAVLVSFNGTGNVSLSSHGMADGTYTDEITGNTFTVSGGTLSGNISDEYGIAVVYKNVMPNPTADYPVQIKNSVGNGTVFYSDSLSVTLQALYADTATYTASTGETGTFSGSTTISLGSNLAAGDSVTLTVSGTNERGTVTKTYTYTKDEYDLTNCIFFKNTSDWSTPTAYLWDASSSTSTKNAAWPGEKMFECDAEQNIFALQIDPEASYTKVIFSNNGSSQTADLAVGDIGYMYNPTTGTWEEYYINTNTTPVITASKASTTISKATDVTFSVRNAETATYSINGATPVSFTDSVDLTVGTGLNDNEADTVVITATNGDTVKTATYTYTMLHTTPVVTASVATGTEFTDSLAVTFTVTDAESATISDGTTTQSISGSVTKTITDSTTFTIVANNGVKDFTSTYSYVKTEYNMSDCIFFKNTANWSNPTAYIWNDTSSTVTNNTSWPGEAMDLIDEANGIYAVHIDEDAGYNKIIFNNNGSSQTADLLIGDIGYMYDYSTGTWSLYYEDNTTAPTVTSSLDSSNITKATSVTFTVKHGDTATYSINGATPVSFTDSVNVTVGSDLEDGESDTVVITATNENGTTTQSYTYTMVIEETNYVYFNMSACSWFTNDSATAAVKFNTDSTYTECDVITYNGTTYFKAAVPDGATSVSVCRLLPSGNTYNALTISLTDDMNVWTSNSSYNGGSWSAVATIE